MENRQDQASPFRTAKKPPAGTPGALVLEFIPACGVGGQGLIASPPTQARQAGVQIENPAAGEGAGPGCYP